MKSTSRPFTAFNKICPVTKKPAPCIVRKLHRQRESAGGSEYSLIIKDDVDVLSRAEHYVNNFRRKSAPELPPITNRLNSLSTCRRHSADYISNSSSKSYLDSYHIYIEKESVTSSPSHGSYGSDLNVTETETATGTVCVRDLKNNNFNAIMNAEKKKDVKKYRPRLPSRERSTVSRNNTMIHIKKVFSQEKPLDSPPSPPPQLTRSKTFTKSVKKKSKGQKRNTKSNLVYSRTLSIDNIDQLTRSRTLDNEHLCGLRKATSTQALDTRTPATFPLDNNNGNGHESSSETDDESDFNKYIMNWIKNVESAGLEPPPDPKIEYREEPTKKDTAVHIVHDS